MTKLAENNPQGAANIADDHVLYTVCGFSVDYYCKNPKKCKHKTRLYTAPNEKGKQLKTNLNVCQQYICLNGV